MKTSFIPAAELFAEWHSDPGYVAAYHELDDEFELLEALTAARKNGRNGTDALPSQAEIARRMGTSQPAVARLEGGRGNPSLATLRRYAEATGTKLKITFERTVEPS